MWPVITVHFSNHPAGTWRGPLSAADLRDVVQGIDERGVLGDVDGAVGLSGVVRTSAR